jgi:hypothetical protein
MKAKCFQKCNDCLKICSMSLCWIKPLAMGLPNSGLHSTLPRMGPYSIKELGFNLHFIPSSYFLPILKRSKKFPSVFKGHLVFVCTPKIYIYIYILGLLPKGKLHLLWGIRSLPLLRSRCKNKNTCTWSKFGKPFMKFDNVIYYCHIGCVVSSANVNTRLMCED